MHAHMPTYCVNTYNVSGRQIYNMNFVFMSITIKYSTMLNDSRLMNVMFEIMV